MFFRPFSSARSFSFWPGQGQLLPPGLLAYWGALGLFLLEQKSLASSCRYFSPLPFSFFFASRPRRVSCVYSRALVGENELFSRPWTQGRTMIFMCRGGCGIAPALLCRVAKRGQDGVAVENKPFALDFLGAVWSCRSRPSLSAGRNVCLWFGHVHAEYFAGTAATRALRAPRQQEGHEAVESSTPGKEPACFVFFRVFRACRGLVGLTQKHEAVSVCECRAWTRNRTKGYVMCCNS